MLKLLKVTGNSLMPYYQEGDFVLTTKIPFLFKSLQRGDIIAFRHPAYGTLIKRVERIDPNTGDVFVLGTHPESIDSRHFGMIPRQDLLGKVIAHIRKPRPA